MARFLAQARFIIGAFAVALILTIAAPAGAQQPTSVNPTAASVKEQQLLNALGSGGLYDTCKAVAQTNYGFNISQYDFIYVVTAGASPARALAAVYARPCW